MERNSRKVYVGKVVSAKCDKTITVMVETYRKHPLYGKRVKYSKKFTAHDELNQDSNFFCNDDSLLYMVVVSKSRHDFSYIIKCC